MQDMIVTMHISSIFFEEKPTFFSNIKKRLQNCEGVHPISINQWRGSFHLYLLKNDKYNLLKKTSIIFFMSTKNLNENAISSIHFHNAERLRNVSVSKARHNLHCIWTKLHEVHLFIKRVWHFIKSNRNNLSNHGAWNLLEIVLLAFTQVL